MADVYIINKKEGALSPSFFRECKVNCVMLQ